MTRRSIAGWEVEVADAINVKGLAPLACKTDWIDAWVLAEPSVARIDIARRLTEAIWHMLTRNQPSAPAGAARPLAA